MMLKFTVCDDKLRNIMFKGQDSNRFTIWIYLQLKENKC